MATETRPEVSTPARGSELELARARWVGLLSAVVLVGCGGSDDESGVGDPVVLGDDGPVRLSVFAGCENEFHGTCDVLDAECQNRVFSTARCLRHQPEAVLPVVRVISKEELIAEVMSESSEVTDAADEEALADATASETLARALELLGLAEAGEISDESYAQVFVDTVPAFYSSEDGVVTLVDGAGGDASRNTLSLFHELVHALQDQASNLAALDSDEALSFDQYLAALSIVEGEAEMLESFVEAASWRLDQDPNFRKFYTSWVPSAEAAFAGQSPLLVSPRYFPYSYGARFVFDVFGSEGIAGVRALFETPPVSVLPMMLNAVGPVDITPVSLLEQPEPNAPIGFTRHEPGGFGPWVFAKFVERVVPDVLDANLPSHWRGDRFLAWSSDDRGMAAVWTVRLDTRAAAGALFYSLRELTLMGLPSANAFCVQSGQDVTIGVTDESSTRDAWATAVTEAPTDSPAASAVIPPAGTPAATPPSPAAAPPSAAPPDAAAGRRGLPRAWRTTLPRLARRPR